MASEKLVMGGASLIFAGLAVVLWGDYLKHSAEVYDARDAASAQLRQISVDLAAAQDETEIGRLNDEKFSVEADYLDASRRIEDMDGWNTPEWKLKNTLRLATPAVAVLLAAFALLAILHPLRPDG